MEPHNISKFADTYINLPLTAMSIAIVFCCVSIAKLSCQSAKNGNF